jgi:CRP/FNR family transcriptional regulator, cyclic AMP receptor protein
VSSDPPLLAALTEEARASLLQRCRRRQYGRGAYLVYEGDPGDSLHLIVRGRVGVLIGGADGNPFTVALMGPGDFFGEQALLNRAAVRSASIQAVEPTETLVIGRGEFEELRQQYPEVDRLLIVVLVSMVDRPPRQVAELTDVPGTVRIYRRIVALAELYGDTAAPDGAGDDRPDRDDVTPIEIPLTQDQLAGLAGVHLRLTSRVLGEARAAGLLDTSTRRLVVRDLEGLRRRAALGPTSGQGAGG